MYDLFYLYSEDYAVLYLYIDYFIQCLQYLLLER